MLAWLFFFFFSSFLLCSLPFAPAGGLFKEFLTTLAHEAFSPQYGLFKENERFELYPNPNANVVVEGREKAGRRKKSEEERGASTRGSENEGHPFHP